MNRDFKRILLFVSIALCTTLNFAASNNSVEDAKLSIRIGSSSGVISCHNTFYNTLANCLVTLDAMLENTGYVEITNTSRVTAYNIKATLPSNWSDVINTSVCSSVGPRQVCRLEFRPGSMLHPITTIPVAGTNTNTVYFDMQVIA